MAIPQMSDKKRALAIEVAKDVLATIKAQQVKVRSAYGFVRSDEGCAFTGDSKVDAAKAQKECTVCALGAALLSVVKLHNKFDFASHNDSWGSRYNLNVTALIERLKSVFTLPQMALIENAFEMGTGGHFQGEYILIEDEVHGLYGDEDDLSSSYKPAKNDQKPFAKAVRAAIKFGELNEDPTERLKAIMKNIVRNGGEFIPPGTRSILYPTS